MKRRAGRLQHEEGFTLVELIIGMAIVGLLVGAIGNALIVSLKTTDVTNQRMSKSHDVQITSAYLANDVQGASAVDVSSSSADCGGASTTLVTFTYSSGQTASYTCGTASSETRVSRTFSGPPVDTVVLAHFAGTARPTITCAPTCTSNPVDSVTIAFSESFSAGESAPLNYSLFGSRRAYPAPGGGGSSTPPDITLLSTGTSSPLWVQGSCPDPGTSSACIVDPSKTALPISDVTTAGWAPFPATPTTLFDKLRDGDVTTYVTNAPGSKSEAKVALSSVDPPDSGTNPTVEFHASTAGGGAQKVTISLYDGPTLLVSNQVGPINQPNNYDWALAPAETNLIPASAYAHLTVGFAATKAKAGDIVNVDGVAFDTLDTSAVGLLTIKGALTVNSQLSSAVRLTGVKTATKITINNGGDFRIWNPGACSGCNHNTVNCAACTWIGNQPWTNYATSIPDPLRSLAAPSKPAPGSCSGSVCQPGDYSSTLSLTTNTTLNPGIYYLEQGISVTGTASLSCASPCTGGVMLYIAGGSVTFAGSSSVNLTAPSSGTYKNILIFQARTDTNALKVAGNAGSGVTNVFNGVIYVPNSVQVTLATGSASLTAKAIVAQNIKVSSSVTIG